MRMIRNKKTVNGRLWLFQCIITIFCCMSIPHVLGINLADDPVVELAMRDCEEDAAEKDTLMCLYRVAQRWYHLKGMEGSAKKKEAIHLYTWLANEEEKVHSWRHVPSMVALGHYYATDGNDKDEALRYFKMAADIGSNHSAMYNAGNLMAEHSKDYVGAMAYIHTAATLTNTDIHKNVVKENMLIVSKQAYEILSARIASMYSQLPLTEIADIFLYAKPIPSDHDNDKDTPSMEEEEEMEQMWTNAIIAAVQIEAMYVNNENKNIESSMALYREVTNNLHLLWQRYSEKILSPLQEYLLLQLLNDTLAANADDQDNAYVLVTARYSHALAMNQYCYEQYDECFQPTASNSISSYERSNNAKSEEALSMAKLAREHPSARITSERDL